MAGTPDLRVVRGLFLDGVIVGGSSQCILSLNEEMNQSQGHFLITDSEVEVRRFGHCFGKAEPEGHLMYPRASTGGQQLDIEEERGGFREEAKITRRFDECER